MGVAQTCTMRITYTHIAYRPAGHNVSAVLRWAAISVLGMEYGRWPTVIMHTAYKAAHLLAQLQHFGRLRTSDPRGRKIPEASQGLVQRGDQYSGDTGGTCAPQREPATA